MNNASPTRRHALSHIILVDYPKDYQVDYHLKISDLLALKKIPNEDYRDRKAMTSQIQFERQNLQSRVFKSMSRPPLDHFRQLEAFHAIVWKNTEVPFCKLIIEGYCCKN